MQSPTQNPVVVITGASSGIGRATALEFARRGASVVLAARREEPLEDAAGACERLGGRALAVPTDVTDPEAVERLLGRAVDEFGRVDVWVNNAAVTAFGRFEEIPPDSFRQVLETNLLGYVHGARAVLPHFRERGGGVLINVDSVVGRAPEPSTSPYVTSKFAIRGLNEVLRLENEGTGIHVCLVLPASIDTPLYQHAANYSGYGVKPLRPIIRPERVAKAIASVAEQPERETFVGLFGRLGVQLYDLAPGLYERLASRLLARGHFTKRPTPPTDGNLFHPEPEGTTSRGGWKRRVGVRAALGTAAALATVALARRRRSP